MSIGLYQNKKLILIYENVVDIQFTSVHRDDIYVWYARAPVTYVFSVV